LSFIRPILGGKMLEEVLPLGEGPTVITVMPGAAKAVVAEQPGEVTRIQVAVESGVTRTLGYREGPKRTLDLVKAEVIVAAGRGLGGPENLHLVKELAACFAKSAVAASRPVVDYGWLPLEHQVGMTGQTVAPGLYIACGISGALQHLMGMNQSRLVVAINTDPGAPIFQLAHFGVCADLLEFLPVLTRKLREAGEGR
jgi:electron transfer flavoprotein alpha subunit